MAPRRASTPLSALGALLLVVVVVLLQRVAPSAGEKTTSTTACCASDSSPIPYPCPTLSRTAPAAPTAAGSPQLEAAAADGASGRCMHAKHSLQFSHPTSLAGQPPHTRDPDGGHHPGVHGDAGRPVVSARLIC